MRPTERTTSALADNQARVSRPVVFAPCDPRGPQPVGRLCPGDSPSRDIRVGCVPSPSGSSQPGGRTWVSGLQVASVSPEPPGQPGRYTGRRFSDWLPRGLAASSHPRGRSAPGWVRSLPSSASGLGPRTHAIEDCPGTAGRPAGLQCC